MAKVFSLLLLLFVGGLIATIWVGSSWHNAPIFSRMEKQGGRPAWFSGIAGAAMAYQYEYSVQGDIKEPRGLVEPDFSVSGVLHVRFLVVDETKVVLGMQLQGATIQRGNEIEPFDPGIVLNELDRDGKLVGQVAAKFFNEGSARFVRELFNLQVAVSSDDSLNHWTVTENDSLGAYTASYKKIGANGLHKEKQQYLQENSVGELKVIQSFAEIDLNPTWLANYESIESVEDMDPNTGTMEYTIARKLHQNSVALEKTLSLYALDLESGEEVLKNTILNQELSGSGVVQDSPASHTGPAISFGAILIQLMENRLSARNLAISRTEQAEKRGQQRPKQSSESELGDLPAEEANLAIQTLQKNSVKSPEDYSFIEKLLRHHPNDAVRMAALDFFVQDENEQYFDLAIVALDDHSKTIRLAAAQRLLESKYDSRDSVVHGLMNRLAAEDEVAVKGALYLALSPHRKSHPEIDVLLKAEKASVGPELVTFIEEASR